MIYSTLTVSSDAESTNLTTRTRVKTMLAITSSDEDAYLDMVIPQASAAACNYIGVRAGDDGLCTLGKETVIETFRLTREEPGIPLSRWPVVSITTVVEDDDEDELESDEYEIDKPTGILRRLDGDENRLNWTSVKVTVTYIAGWVLPGDSGTRTLPYDIEDAVISLIKAARAARTRDPLIRSESVDGVGRTDYWVRGIGESGGIPPDVASKLDPYRNLNI